MYYKIRSCIMQFTIDRVLYISISVGHRFFSGSSEWK